MRIQYEIVKLSDVHVAFNLLPRREGWRYRNLNQVNYCQQPATSWLLLTKHLLKGPDTPLRPELMLGNVTKHSACTQFEANWCYRSLIMADKWGKQSILSVVIYYTECTEDPLYGALLQRGSSLGPSLINVFSICQWLRKALEVIHISPFCMK